MKFEATINPECFAASPSAPRPSLAELLDAKKAIEVIRGLRERHGRSIDLTVRVGAPHLEHILDPVASIHHAIEDAIEERLRGFVGTVIHRGEVYRYSLARGCCVFDAPVDSETL